MRLCKQQKARKLVGGVWEREYCTVICQLSGVAKFFHRHFISHFVIYVCTLTGYVDQLDLSLPLCSCTVAAATPPFLSAVTVRSRPSTCVCSHHARDATWNWDGKACSTAAIPALPLPATPTHATTYGPHTCSPSRTVQPLSHAGYWDASRYDQHARSSRPASHASCQQHDHHGNTPPGTCPLPNATHSPDNASCWRVPASISAIVPGETHPAPGAPDGQSPWSHDHGSRHGSPARIDGDARDAAATGRTTIWLSQGGGSHWDAVSHCHTQPILLWCDKCSAAPLSSSLCHSHLQREWYPGCKAIITLLYWTRTRVQTTG